MQYEFNNFYELIHFQAKKQAKKVAILIDNKKITYSQILKNVDNLSVTLANKGIKEGESVALFLGNSEEFIYSVFAISKLGAIVVPINTFLKEEELNFILKDSEAVALLSSTLYKKVVCASDAKKLCNFILWEGEDDEKESNHLSFYDALTFHGETKVIKRRLEDIAVLMYTSGTTGNPKGAMLTNKNILSNIYAGKQSINLTEKDRSILFLPMFHTFTFTVGMMLPLYSGASLVIVKSIYPFSNIFKQTLLKRVTLFFGIPDVFNALAKVDLPWYFMYFNTIRVFVSGASPLHNKTLRAMSKKFTKASLLEGYGLSEASPAVCMNTLSKQKVGSVGKALHNYKIKIIDEDNNTLDNGDIGDIIVRGDNVMKGYYNHPEATSKTIIDGWLHTGDLGYLDDDGFLFIVDRKKDLIISKGINIYPREIEDIVHQFEGIAMCAVIAKKDGKFGEIPILCIELEYTEIDIFKLKEFMRTKIADYKIPKQIHTLDKLPKNATGKILKRTLREMFNEENE